MPAAYLLQKSKNRKFFFNLLAPNKERILTSEMYNSKKGARNGVASVKKNSKSDGRFKREKSKRGRHYFTLLAKNNKTIGTSEEYSSKTAMEKGVAAVKRVARLAKLLDRTK